MAGEELFLGIDVGTSSLNVVAIDVTGMVRGAASSAYETIVPQPGWFEQRPEDWWRACREAVAALRSDVPLNAVAAIGITGHMHGAVFLDADRDVIRPALLWNDQRAAAEAALIESTIGRDRLVLITGSRSHSGLTASRLLWLRNNATIAYKRLHHVLLPKDYIRLRLTGDLATDVAAACGTGLFDVKARAWSVEIIDALDLDADVLPKVFEGTHVTGLLLPDVAAELGLPANVPLIAGGGDLQAQAASATGARHAAPNQQSPG